MVAIQKKLILWTGEKHCGKTTGAAKLVEVARDEGFNAAGLLAPSLYCNGRLIGFDAVDVRNKTRASLVRRKTNTSETWPFTFIAEGLKLGGIALSSAATKGAELVIVDEFGPLEFDGGGWRKDVDSLLTSADALILLVVRQELVEQVQQLYVNVPSQKLAATELKSIDKVITMLKHRREQIRLGKELVSR